MAAPPQRSPDLPRVALPYCSAARAAGGRTLHFWHHGDGAVDSMTSRVVLGLSLVASLTACGLSHTASYDARPPPGDAGVTDATTDAAHEDSGFTPDAPLDAGLLDSATHTMLDAMSRADAGDAGPVDAPPVCPDAGPANGYGDTCFDDADCISCEANLCVIPPGAGAGTCTRVCTDMPELCPADFRCFDLRVFDPTAPDLFAFCLVD